MRQKRNSTVEGSLITILARRFGGRGAGIVLGIGDDAAVYRVPSGDVVISVDACVEGVHFDRKLVSLSDIGRRALVAALSDLAAMGAQPKYYLVSLQSPRGRQDVLPTQQGMHEAAQEYGVRLIGGNLAKGQSLAIHTTVLGFAGTGRILRRNGARPSDGIYVSGRLGGPAWGLTLLRSGRKRLLRAEKGAVQRFLRPRARFDAAHLLVESRVATSAIDVSDGLLLDLERLCRMSGVGARVDPSLIPICPGLPTSPKLNERPLWSGGEEYEILCTIDEDGLERLPPVQKGRFHRLFTRIGTIERGRGVRLYFPDGHEVDSARMKHLGWDHWGS